MNVGSALTGLVAGFQPRQAIAAALFTALLLHNMEEGLTYARYVPSAEAVLHSLWGHPVVLPALSAFVMALVAATLLGGGLLLWAAHGPETAGRWRALRFIAALLLLNVALPHVPAAFLLGGYAPGLVTALLINTPLAVLVLQSGEARHASANSLASSG